MNSLAYPLGWIPLLPLLGALFAGLVGPKLPKRIVGIICSGTVALACLLAIGGVFKLLVASNEPFAVNMANALGFQDWISAETQKVLASGGDVYAKSVELRSLQFLYN